MSKRSRFDPDHRIHRAAKRTPCPVCEGVGWTADHDPACCGADCERMGCPIQVQCDHCSGSGSMAP